LDALVRWRNMFWLSNGAEAWTLAVFNTLWRELTFGMLICNDSNHPELARFMAAQGATALFVPTNNALPLTRAHWDLASEARNVDIATAVENSMWVIRADVAGLTPDLVSYGSSGIVNADGMVLWSGRRFRADLVVADIETAPRERRRGERLERQPCKWMIP
jgi:predicted amidohydrolase